MKTQACQLFAYCETTGAPVGICSLVDATTWQGTDQEQTLYWEVVQAIGQNLLFEFDAVHRFFNTETGNFTLFRSTNGAELVVAEIICIGEQTVMPWNGIAFTCDTATRIPAELKGLICFFDAALTVPSSLAAHTSLYAVDQTAPWNIAVLDCDYDAAYEAEFKSDAVHLQGICFRRERT